MKKALCLVLLSLGMAYPTFAQSDTLFREVGFSTQIIFNHIFSTAGTPFELMLKRQKKSNQWMRYGLGTSLSAGESGREGNEQAENYAYTSSGFHFSPSIGLEKRVLLSERWRFIYGSDVAATYSQQENKSRRSFISDTLEYNCRSQQKEKAYGASLKPFLGILFSPAERLYVSTEASALFGGFIKKVKARQYQADALQSEIEEEQWHFNLDFLPASAIFVYYRF